MFKWLRKLFAPSKAQLEMIEAIDKLFEEYDVYTVQKGGIRRIMKYELKRKRK